MTAKPYRIQRKRIRGWRMPEDAVYVGRPTKWGNPFRVSKRWGIYCAGDRRTKSHQPIKVYDVVEAYKNYLPGLLRSQPGISLEQLRGKNLCCWCPLDVPCHADVLLEIANS